MIGDALIAQILKQENVDWIGAYPYHSLIDEAAKINIKPIIPRQERAGVNMADGFSRINNGNKIGVFIMQRGPGAENAFGGVAQAFSDAVPILLLPGGHERTKTQMVLWHRKPRGKSPTYSNWRISILIWVRYFICPG